MKKINVMLAAAALTMGMMGAAQAAPYQGYADGLAGVKGTNDSNVVHKADGVQETTSSDKQSGMANYEGLKKSGYWCSPTSHDTYLTGSCGEAFATDKAINKILTTYDDNDKFLYDQINGTVVTDANGNAVKDADGNVVRTGGVVGTIGDLDGLRPNVKDYLLTEDPTVVDAVNAVSDSVAAETAARLGADAEQDKRIDTVVSTLGAVSDTLAEVNQNVADGFNALSAVDQAEAAAREAGDAAEAAAREAADKTLQSNIDAEAAAREAGDAAEAAAREAADAAMDAKIGDTKYASTNYVTAGSSLTEAVGALDGALANEASEREAADAALGNRIDQLDKGSKQGIARAVALAGLHPLDYDPDNKLDIAAAGGFYKNQNAFAIGAFYRPNRNVMVSFGTSVTGNDDAYNVGVSFKVGRSGEKKAKACPSTEDLYAMLSAMQEKIDAQQARIEELEAK